MLNRVPPLRGCKLWRSAPHRFTVGYGVSSLTGLAEIMGALFCLRATELRRFHLLPSAAFSQLVKIFTVGIASPGRANTRKRWPSALGL